MTSSKLDAFAARLRRGGRVKNIRESLGLNGDEFGALLLSHLEPLGITRRYDASLVSKIEGASRDLTVEEAAIISELDPEGRGIGWLVFGDEADERFAPIDPAMFPEAETRAAKKRSRRA